MFYTSDEALTLHSQSDGEDRVMKGGCQYPEAGRGATWTVNHTFCCTMSTTPVMSFSLDCLDFFVGAISVVSLSLVSIAVLMCYIVNLYGSIGVECSIRVPLG